MPHTHIVNSKIQAWLAFLKIVYSLYRKFMTQKYVIIGSQTWSAWIDGWKVTAKKDR